MDENVLSRCLGPDFARMPDLVQRAHQGLIHLRGTVVVTRGRGIGGLIAAIMGLPPANSACAMTVRGEHLPEQLIWQRDFAGIRMVSNFSRYGDQLVEAMGPLRLSLRPEVVDGCLHYRLTAARIGPLNLPSWLMPRLTAWERERDGHYEFEVDIKLPLLGRLVRYGGLMELDGA